MIFGVSEPSQSYLVPVTMFQGTLIMGALNNLNMLMGLLASFSKNRHSALTSSRMIPSIEVFAKPKSLNGEPTIVFVEKVRRKLTAVRIDVMGLI